MLLSYGTSYNDTKIPLIHAPFGRVTRPSFDDAAAVDVVDDAVVVVDAVVAAANTPSFAAAAAAAPVVRHLRDDRDWLLALWVAWARHWDTRVMFILHTKRTRRLEIFHLTGQFLHKKCLT